MHGYAFFWIALGVILGIIEASTSNLTTIWMAISSIIVAALSSLGLSPVAQLLVFAVISALLLLLTRPLSKHILSKKSIATNADRIISRKGLVTEAIDPIENSGKIRVMGQTWSAKSESGDPISPGTEVTVLRIEGVRAVCRI